MGLFCIPCILAFFLPKINFGIRLFQKLAEGGSVHQSRKVFDAAVLDLEKLLNDKFWIPLLALLSHASLAETRYEYGPNKSMVSLGSELFLGHHDYNPVLLDFSSENPPVLLLDERRVLPRFALKCLFGLSGQRAGQSPYEVLERIILDVEKRVSISRQIAWHDGDAGLICANNLFELEYFPYFEELLLRYRGAERFMENSVFSNLCTRIQVGFW